jgi:methylenetetrahydrofolate reductase (NADPH)
MVSVTCLPHHGPARTVAASVELARLGYDVVPHLAARSIASQAELHLFLKQLRHEGVSELFLIAGDRSTPAGPYSWSGQLMEDVKAFSEEFSPSWPAAQEWPRPSWVAAPSCATTAPA